MSGDDPRPESSVRGQEKFDEEVYPRSYPVPGRINLKRAMRAYVHGHDRGWDAERKAELGSEEDRPDGEGYQGAGQALDRGEQTDRAGAGSDARPEPEEAREGTRYGVPVPEILDFHRSADTWRDRIPRPDSARRPAGWPAGEAADDETRRGD